MSNPTAGVSGTPQTSIPSAEIISSNDLITGLVSGKSRNIPIAILAAFIAQMANTSAIVDLFAGGGVDTEAKDADLVLFLRPVLDNDTGETTYQPHSITPANLLASEIYQALVEVFPKLPDQYVKGQLWVNNGALAYGAPSGSPQASPDTLVGTERNPDAKFGDIADAALSGEIYAITDAMWCASVSSLPTSDPLQAGAFWNDAGVIVVSASGLAFSSTVQRKISIPALNSWMDGLPTSDPAQAGAVWNNSGIPTISASGAGDISGYSGILLREDALNFLMSGLYQFAGVTVQDIGLKNIWINNSNVLTRI